LAKGTMLEIEKDRGTKETMQVLRRHSQCKKADILAEQILVAKVNLCQKGNNMDKSVQVKAMFYSHTVIIGDAMIPTNALEQGSKKEHGIAKKRIITKIDTNQVAKTAMVMKVHLIIQVPIPDVIKDKKKKDTVMEHMKNKNFKWSQCLFLHQYWTSHEVQQFELLAQFLYDTIQEDNIDYPTHLTWIDNVTIGDDSDLYASRLLFVLTCSKMSMMLHCIH